MSTPNATRWIGIGLLGLPLYGALTFWSSLEGQPDPDTQLRAWSRFVTTNEYVIGHLFGSILGLICLIFGAFALGVYLATSRAGRLGLWAMFLTVLGSALFLPLQGLSTFAVPEEGRAEFDGWYEDEHIGLLMQVPGWLRVRRYTVRPGSAGPPWTHLALHELRSTEALDRPERTAARDTPRRHELTRHAWFGDSGRWTYRPIHLAVAAVPAGDARP